MSDEQGMEWTQVATVDEFAETDRKQVDLGPDKEIGIFKLDDGYYAIGIYCSHQREVLFDGPVDDHMIMCPLHGAQFDIKTGQHLSLPAVKPIPSYEVKVDGDNIFVLA